MGPSNDPRRRVKQLAGQFPCIAGLLVATWLMNTDVLRAESWVLHLPMVIGSVAPTSPVEERLGSSLNLSQHGLNMGTSDVTVRPSPDRSLAARPHGALPPSGLAALGTESRGFLDGFPEDLRPLALEMG